MGRRMVQQPNDPRMILRLAAIVTQRELLQPQHLAADLARQPICRCAADSAAANHDVFV
jgi:hypothetical protein